MCWSIPAIWYRVWKDNKPVQLSSPATEVETSGSNHLKKIVPRQFVEQLSKLSFESQVMSFIDCLLAWHVNLDFPRWFRWLRIVQLSPKWGLAADHVPFFIIELVCFARAKCPRDDIIRSSRPFTTTDTGP